MHASALGRPRTFYSKPKHEENLDQICYYFTLGRSKEDQCGVQLVGSFALKKQVIPF